MTLPKPLTDEEKAYYQYVRETAEEIAGDDWPCVFAKIASPLVYLRPKDPPVSQGVRAEQVTVGPSSPLEWRPSRKDPCKESVDAHDLVPGGIEHQILGMLRDNPKNVHRGRYEYWRSEYQGREYLWRKPLEEEAGTR